MQIGLYQFGGRHLLFVAGDHLLPAKKVVEVQAELEAWLRTQEAAAK